MCPADSSGAGPAGQNFRALSARGDMSPRFTQQPCARSRVSKKHVLSVWNRARVQGRFGQYSTSGQDGRGAARPTLPGLCPPPRARVPCAPAEEAGHELDLTREGARSARGDSCQPRLSDHERRKRAFPGRGALKRWPLLWDSPLEFGSGGAGGMDAHVRLCPVFLKAVLPFSCISTSVSFFAASFQCIKVSIAVFL